MPATVHLGFSVPGADPVVIPLSHLVVVGQTQQSGKTTTLEALLARSGVRAVTFVTKRGEQAFRQTGHALKPYFRQQADWVFVSSLIDLTVGGKNKILHSFLMKVCRNTRTLQEVLDRVQAARDQARRGFDESIYQQILGYLELVVPQLDQQSLARSITLTDGLNVMDLSGYSVELQALCIRSALDHVYEHETDTVVVIPEAWEFLPEGKGSPVKAAAERLIRKGAALHNFLWVDSQDLAGVWKTVVRSCAVALIGVQREANEIKRTLANIPAGIAKPSAADVAQLGLGQFYACWKAHTVKTYVQPRWMTEVMARSVAQGVLSAETSASIEALKRAHHHAFDRAAGRDTDDEDDDMSQLSDLQAEYGSLEAENAKLHRDLADVKAQLASLQASYRLHTETERSPVKRAIPASGKAAGKTSPEEPTLPPSTDLAALAVAVAAELRKDPTLLRISLAHPEMEITMTRHTVTQDGSSSLGLVARLLKGGFFDKTITATAAWHEMKRYGFAGVSARAYEACDKLVGMGFLTKEKDGYRAVAGRKADVREGAA
jgi:hypothetical protein